MNEHFVPIKVDREERPDVDSIYMEAVQGMTGQGGWPMTVFLDTDGVPFYGGTYFPPEPRHGMPSFRDGDGGGGRVVGDPARADPRRRRRGSATQLGAVGRIEPSARAVTGEAARGRGQRSCAMAADMRHGGFGGAPKFPPSSALELLLARGEHRASSR